MPEELRFPIKVRHVWIDQSAEGAVGEMDGPSQLRAVVAAPVEDRIGVADAVTGFELHGDTVRQWHRAVGEQLLVLGLGVWPPVRAGHDPEHGVIVQRHVPLYHTRRIFAQIALQPRQRRLIDRVDVPVPARGTAIFHRAAHQEEADGRRIFAAHQLTTHAHRVRVQREVDGIRRRFIDDLIVRQPRLSARFPDTAGWIIRLCLARPDRLLALHKRCEASPQLIQHVRWNAFGNDGVSIIEKLF